MLHPVQMRLQDVEGRPVCTLLMAQSRRHGTNGKLMQIRSSTQEPCLGQYNLCSQEAIERTSMRQQTSMVEANTLEVAEPENGVCEALSKQLDITSVGCSCHVHTHESVLINGERAEQIARLVTHACFALLMQRVVSTKSAGVRDVGAWWTLTDVLNRAVVGS
eukprot:762795-Amphidinium_carterae.1